MTDRLRLDFSSPQFCLARQVPKGIDPSTFGSKNHAEFYSATGGGSSSEEQTRPPDDFSGVGSQGVGRRTGFRHLQRKRGEDD